MFLLAAISSLATISFLLKVGFYPLKWTVFAGVVCAIIVFFATSWVTGLSQEAFVQIIENRSVRLNAALMVFLDSAILLAFCFQNTFPSAKSAPVQRCLKQFLTVYPGLVFGGAVCFFQAQLFFRFAGIDFSVAAWISSLVYLLIVVFGSLALKKIIGERHLRMELLFVTQILMIILSIFITGK